MGRLDSLADLSLFQLEAAIEGHRIANTSEDAEGLTDSESDALFASVQAAETMH